LPQRFLCGNTSLGCATSLHNPLMGVPTKAVGLSNQMTRRSSIDSSTHAEPPSPLTSIRHCSAPITKNRASSMVAFPPTSSCSNSEGSYMSIDTSQRDTSSQFDPRLLLPDAIATPLYVSIHASIERYCFDASGCKKDVVKVGLFHISFSIKATPLTVFC
ncbi:hypothetical protein VP01_4430g2, partial [Puccinia sorghi]